jgi:outer membrane protein OmpA-like peptidoglycan-associated protein
MRRIRPARIGPGKDRFPVYFDEFSVTLTAQARGVIADTAKQARDGNARAIRIGARASAPGSPTANKYLAMARSQVVADELARDGVDAALVRQVPIGQTGSEDPSVAERRVDIVPNVETRAGPGCLGCEVVRAAARGYFFAASRSRMPRSASS